MKKHQNYSLTTEKHNKIKCLMTGLGLLLLAIFNLQLAVKAGEPCSFDTGRGGDRDCKFGDTGRVLTQVSAEGDSFAYDLAIQSDGKIVAVGTAQGNGDEFAIVRYKSSGDLDTTFGSSGIVTTGIGYFEAVAYAVAIQSDGKIVVGGISNSGFNSPDYDFTVVRYNSNGSLDTSWGTGGVVVTDLGLVYEGVNGLVIQNDGKIVAVGYSRSDPSNPSTGNIKAVRYNTNGTLDSGFGTAGVVTGPKGVGEDVVLQSDGKILIAGYGGQDKDFITARYNTNGTLDTSFDTDGLVYTDFGSSDDRAKGIALQRDGKIVLAGSRAVSSSRSDVAVVRLNTNGSLDTSFDGDGKVTTDYATEDVANDVVIQKDGRIVAAGEFRLSPGSTFLGVARYNPDGSLDNGFGNGGISYTGYGYTSAAYGVALQKDGKIVTAGDSWFLIFNTSLLHYFHLISFRPGGYSPMPRGAFDFDADGLTDMSVFRPSTNNLIYQPSSGGSAVQTSLGASGDKIAPADYDGDWKTDLAVYRPSNGTWYILASSTNTVASVQFGASGDIPLPGYFYDDGTADLGVFRPSTGVWYWYNTDDGTNDVQQFGQSGDVPVTADFNNDGESDLAVFRPSNGTWYWKKISDNSYTGVQFGQNGDVPVVGDYDGDGKTDYAVVRVENGYTVWYLLRSTAGVLIAQYGVAGDRPVPADYDGDGKTDLAVWRSSNTSWYWQNSSNGVYNTNTYGASGDLPVPSA